MISWFGEFGYHSRVILDIIYAFIYMKSLYDFTISTGRAQQNAQKSQTTPSHRASNQNWLL